MKTLAQHTPMAIKNVFSGRPTLGNRRLRPYRRKVEEWYDKHPLGFDIGTVDIRQVYVPLQYENGTRRNDMYQRVNEEPRTVVLGAPGAGKSLLLKSAILNWAENRNDSRIPVLVDLHRCNTTKKSLKELIVAELDRAIRRNADALVDRALIDGRLRVFFDGLDEVGRADHGRVVLGLKEFARKYSECQIVVTCRSAAYYGQLDADFEHIVRVAEFDDASIRRFLSKWKDIGGAPGVDRIFGALRRDPELMRLARSPLLLTMIAYLQSGDRREAVGALPNSRAAFYEQAIAHLLDRDRQLGRKEAIGLYHANRKLLTLERIALTLQETRSTRADRMEISREQLDIIIKELLPGFNFGTEHIDPLLDEIVMRSQLLLPLDKIDSSYAFVHLTLQEYLAAKALHNDSGRLMQNYRRDPDSWRETVKMWCAVASVDCTAVVSEINGAEDLRHRVLALECIADAVHVDSKLADRIVDDFIGQLGVQGRDGRAVAAGLGALAASSGPRGTDVLQRLNRIASEDCRRGLAAVQALSESGRPEAAETLVALAGRRNDEHTNIAIHEMGEVAVEALSRAGRGQHWVVEVLAAIGTPAAAQALCEFLWAEDRRMNIGAAWKLASLIRNPDVEEGLRHVWRPDRYSAELNFLWIWTPFEKTASSLTMIVSRIAFLLDRYGKLTGDRDDAVLDTEPADVIDSRIGIPLVAMGLHHSRQKNGPVVTGEIVKLVELARIEVLTGHVRLVPGVGNLERMRFLLTHRAAARPDRAGYLIRLRNSLLRSYDVPGRYRDAIRALKWPVQMMLLGLFLAERETRVTQPMWLSVLANPRRPRLLRGIFIGALVIALIGAIFLDGIYARVTAGGTETLGFDRLGPSWSGWLLSGEGILVVVAAFFVVVVVRLATARLEDWDPEEITRHQWIALLTLSGIIFVAICNGLIVAYITLAAWSSWLVASFIASAVVLVIAGPAVLLRRRYRAIANPLRRCLIADVDRN